MLRRNYSHRLFHFGVLGARFLLILNDRDCMDLGGSGRVMYQLISGRCRSRPTVLRVVFYPYCLLAAGDEGLT